MTRRFPVFTAALFMLAGCATPQPQGPMVDDTSFFLGSFDKVWEVTFKVLEKNSLVVKDFDREKGEITTKFANYSVGPKAHHELDTIAERPQVRLGLYTQVGYTLTLRLVAVNDMNTQVKVTAHIEAYDTNATKKWQPCISKGVLEREMLEKIRNSL
ncbi:MAG TPA: hypothetical protein PLT09_00710 [Deltaproteobacteria bacterium]|nr:hypothetical protein [Deltaproteobacteria bacterium]HPR53870.1 hypothetical protein [Deltaproteobacteria bacterium]HXK45930.1 hypothetical protein [Deltaproteobacteria bacterium]